MQQWPFVVLSFGLLWLSYCLAIDFCEIKACQGMPHVGCNNSMKFDQGCLRDRRLVKMEMYRSYFLAMHNTYRQRVASGEIGGLPKAQHMPELVWDIYLALVAEYHLKRCLRELNDVCVATDDFPEPAVNYGDDLQARALHLISNMRQVTFLTESWLHEVYQLQSIRTETAPRAIRHIINDRAAHMGCAAGQNYDNWNVRFVLICYYDVDAPRKQNLYTSGDFLESQCTAGRSQRYANLCRTLPKYVQNMSVGEYWPE